MAGQMLMGLMESGPHHGQRADARRVNDLIEEARQPMLLASMAAAAA